MGLIAKMAKSPPFPHPCPPGSVAATALMLRPG